MVPALFVRLLILLSSSQVSAAFVREGLTNVLVWHDFVSSILQAAAIMLYTQASV